MQLKERAVHGLWLAGMTLAAVLRGGWLFHAVLSSVCAVALAEWYALCQRTPRLQFSDGLVVMTMFYDAVERLQTSDRAGLLWLLVTVWSTDVGAMFWGAAIGGPKLPAFVSAGKALAGVAGGIGTGTLVGTALFAAPLYHTLTVAAAAQMGDLVESACKRVACVKDSNLDGLAIPGHGGLLDRIDALLAAAPVALALRGR